MNIVFMGTPDFAVPSLQKLVQHHFNILAVVTAPDKLAGRGMKEKKNEVKIFAEQHHLNILQPSNLKDQSFVNQLKTLNADIHIVVAFRMLPEVIWNMPKLGTVNVHGSLLPKYKGAAPIHWAIINGETETGVSTFKLKHQLDTGNILLQKKININEEDTTGIVYDKLKYLGAELLIETLVGLKNNTIKEIEQQKIDNGFYACKITDQHCLIDWNNKAQDIKNLVRGLNPFPTAHFYLKNKMIKIFNVSYIINKECGRFKMGEVISDYTTFVKICCADGFIFLEELQLEGKKRMHVIDWLNGNREFLSIININ